MEIVVHIIIISIFLWVCYGLLNNKDHDKIKNEKILRKIDGGDKWFAYKAKVVVFVFIIMLILVVLLFKIVF